MSAQVVINQLDNGAWSLTVDGEELANSVASCQVLIKGANKPAHITLELVDLTRFTGMADVVIDQVLHSVLTKLGWTPPRPA